MVYHSCMIRLLGYPYSRPSFTPHTHSVIFATRLISAGFGGAFAPKSCWVIRSAPLGMCIMCGVLRDTCLYNCMVKGARLCISVNDLSSIAPISITTCKHCCHLFLLQLHYALISDPPLNALERPPLPPPCFATTYPPHRLYDLPKVCGGILEVLRSPYQLRRVHIAQPFP